MHILTSLSRRSFVPCCASLLAAAGLAVPASAQFADSCDAAPTVGLGSFTFDLTNASAGAFEYEPPCASDRQPYIDQWVRFVPTTTGPVSVTTVGLTTGDTVLSVHSDFCEYFEYYVTACNDDSNGTPQSRLQFPAVAGEAVLIRVAGAMQTRFSGSVRIEAVPPLDAGDTCADPAPAALGTNTYDVTRSYQDGYSCSGFRDTWFTFTPAQRGGLAISTCDVRSNPNISVFRTCDGEVLGCSGYEVCSLGLAVEADVPLLIRLANEDATGPETFTISLDPSAIPVNDECAEALPVSTGNTDFDNTYATSLDQLVCATGPFPFTGGLDLWFSFTPPESGTYDISTEQSVQLRDTILAMYDGCDAQPFICNNDSRGFLSFIRTPLLGGRTYLIQVAGAGLPFSGTPIDRGTGVLSIRQSVPPVNDNCETPEDVGTGVFAYDVYDATTGPNTVSCLASNRIAPNDVWFRHTPLADGPVEVSLLPGGAAGSLSVFDSCEEGFARESAGLYFDTQTGVDIPRLILAGQAGQPVLLRVSYEQYEIDPQLPIGAGELSIGAPTRPTPPNDRCENAAPLTDGETFVNLEGSIKDCSASPLPSFDSCAAVTDNDLFFRYIAPSSGTVNIIINDGVDYPNFDGLVASVYEACGAPPIACSFALGDAPQGSLSFSAASGAEYIVRIASVLRYGSQNILAGSILVGMNPPCDPDVSQDGNADQGDVDYLVNVIAGGQNPTGVDPDFNHDGNVDQGDIDALINVVAGGACP